MSTTIVPPSLLSLPSWLRLVSADEIDPTTNQLLLPKERHHVLVKSLSNKFALVRVNPISGNTGFFVARSLRFLLANKVLLGTAAEDFYCAPSNMRTIVCGKPSPSQNGRVKPKWIRSPDVIMFDQLIYIYQRVGKATTATTNPLVNGVRKRGRPSKKELLARQQQQQKAITNTDVESSVFTDSDSDDSSSDDPDFNVDDTIVSSPQRRKLSTITPKTTSATTTTTTTTTSSAASEDRLADLLSAAAAIPRFPPAIISPPSVTISKKINNPTACTVFTHVVNSIKSNFTFFIIGINYSAIILNIAASSFNELGYCARSIYSAK
jgi:hypothetical protein